MEDASINEFRSKVMNGEFVQTKESIQKLNIAEDQARNIEFFLYE